MKPSPAQLDQIKAILDEPVTVIEEQDWIRIIYSSAINSGRVTEIARIVSPLAVVVHINDELHLYITIS